MTWSTATTITGYTGSNYYVFNNSATGALTAFQTASFSSANAASQTWRAAAIVRTGDAVNYADMTVTMRAINYSTGPLLKTWSFPAADAWYIIISNPFNLYRQYLPYSGASWSSLSTAVVCDVSSSTDAEAFVVDAMFLLPAQHGFVAAEFYDLISTYQIDGEYGEILHQGSRQLSAVESRGEIRTVAPGDVVSRLVHTYANTTSDTFTAGATPNVSANVYPRTRHLLGTV